MRKINVRLIGPGVKNKTIIFERENEEIEIIGVVDGREKGDYELNITAIHRVPNGKGRIKIRAIAESGARIKVKGEIVIEENCQKVDDFMDLRVLILDEESSATVDPRLEIKSDDVKASHAASVSMVDGEQIIYMLTRGIDRKDAIGLIKEGFLK